MRSMSEKTFLCLVVILFASVVGHGFTRTNTDVLDYSVTVEPDIANKSVKGSVVIRVQTVSNVVEFNRGDLTVDSVTEKGTPLQFAVNDHKLRISLSERRAAREIEVRYHGSPRRGIRFFPHRQQVNTIFSTRISSPQWKKHTEKV